MKIIYSLGVLGILAAGCASTPPPRELVEARVAYNKASQSQDAKFAVADMHDAQVSLKDAEHKFKDDGDTPETRDAAYIAHRKVIAAEAKGQAVGNLDQKKQLEAGLQKQKDQQLAMTKGALDSTQKQLARSQDAVQSERAARIAAEKSANDALTAIQGLKATEDERGLVLTLSGSVLFQSNSSTLLASAQQRLTEVANALKEDKRSISVVGHTDSTGGDELNQRLSQERAASVQSFLQQHGVPANRLTATGAGKAQPIADNATPEGRANNRRVEIILQRGK